MLSAFSIFDPKKVPRVSTHELPYMETVQFKRSLERTEFEKAAIVSSDISTERKTYCQLLIKQPKDDISMQLKELLTNDMLIALIPNLQLTGNHMLVYSHFYSISGTKFLRHEVNNESPS